MFMNITWSAPAQISLLAPEPADDLAAVMQACWTAVGPTDMELLRLRICGIHGDAAGLAHRTEGAKIDEHRIAALGSWWASDLFTDRERALLAFVEQFVFSVSSMDDGHVDALLATEDPIRVHEIANAVWALDLTTRMDLVARAVL